MTLEDARHFAQHWIESWNAHDLEEILSHYTEDFEMSSPFIAQFTGESSGTLVGKTQVGAYWKAALQQMPDLHFELRDVFVGRQSIIIYYQSVQEKLAAEIFFFNAGGKVYKAMAHYNS